MWLLSRRANGSRAKLEMANLSSTNHQVDVEEIEVSQPTIYLFLPMTLRIPGVGATQLIH